VIKALQELLDSANVDVKDYIIIGKIKEEAGKEIARIAPYLLEDDRGNLILPKMINMAHDEQNEENKIISVKLIGQLCGTFGQQLTESFLAFEILSLGEDVK
jgi:serine/threonine-protein phosphatase 4 regulatory subunit 1